jgi:hypothetical protein
MSRVSDDPMTFSSRAIRHHMPAALRQLNAAYEQQQAEIARRAAAREAALLARKLRMLSKDAVGCSSPTPYEDDDGEGSTSSYAAEQEQPNCLSAAHVMLEELSTSVRQQSGALQRPPSVIRRRAAPSVAEPELSSSDSDEPLIQRVEVERLWATLLVVHTLEALDCCWLVDEDEERTIVDAAREWLEAQAEADERVRDLLAGDALKKAVSRTIKDWKAIQEHQIAQVRNTEVLSYFTALTHIQRATGRVVKSMMTDHGALLRLLHLVAAALCLTVLLVRLRQARSPHFSMPMATSCAGNAS